MRVRRAVSAFGLAGTALALFSVGCSSSSPSARPTPQTVAAPGTTAAASACRGLATGTSTPTKDAATDPLTRAVDRTINVGGVERTYAEFLPARYGATPVPLVIDLHGYQEGNKIHMLHSRLVNTAEKYGFVAVTPQGTGAVPFWNFSGQVSGPDDLGFVGKLIDEAATTWCVDATRIYVTGLSNGALFTSALACRYADKIAAIAPVAGLDRLAGCAPSKPMPVVAFHGTDDAFVGYNGGLGGAASALPGIEELLKGETGLDVKPVEKTLEVWAKSNGCTTGPTTMLVKGIVSKISYGDCKDGAIAELYSAKGGGHVWPGSAFEASISAVTGTPVDDIDANEVMWAFFEQHHR